MVGSNHELVEGVGRYDGRKAGGPWKVGRSSAIAWRKQLSEKGNRDGPARLWGNKGQLVSGSGVICLLVVIPSQEWNVSSVLREPKWREKLFRAWQSVASSISGREKTGDMVP